ncbi:MAG: hypothetical protein M0P42_14965 [Gallionella sp.]|jgi:hypothetical protein|nr:hypothetical protein [Gallionella sp.]
MTATNIAETKALPGAGMHASITVVEETSNLLESYMQLMFDTLEYNINDPAEGRKANMQMYALLVAVRDQMNRLLPMPEALMDGLRELRSV